MSVEQRQNPPAKVRQHTILRKKVWDRIHNKDKNWMGIICGETGSGKSEFGLRMCELIDPNFGPDRVAFTVEEFMQLVQERHPPGSAILFDEVGIALSHAKHYEEEVIRVNHVLQSWREQNRMLVMTAPHLNLIHKPDRGLLHAQLDMHDIDLDRHLATARFRNIIQDTDDGSLYKKYPRLRDRTDSVRKKYRTLQLFKPSPDLVDAYLDKKIAFNEQLNEEVLEQVTPDIGEAEKLSPKEMAERIKERGEVSDITSIHGAHKSEYIDSELIEVEYGLSMRDAKKVKKVLERDEEVTVGE